MQAKTEKILIVFLIFVCAYQIITGLFIVLFPGEGFRFMTITNHPPGGSNYAISWWNNHVSHWRVYQLFNQFYVLSMIVTLIWIKKHGS